MKKLSILAFTPVVALLVPKSAVSQTGLACQGHSPTLPMVGSAPALIGDVLYFTTCAGRAIAVDYESGREVFDMDGPAKTITGDDALLVFTNAFSAQGLSRDSGTRVWQVNTDGSTPGIPKGRIVAYPIVSGDIVLLRLEVASEESTAHEIVGLDRENGRPVWRFRLNGRSLGEDMFASDGTVLVSDGRHAYGINRNDGTARWTTEGTNVQFVGISSTAAFLVEGGQPVARRLLTGKRIWAIKELPNIGTDEALTKGAAVFLHLSGSSDAAAVAVDASTGRELWRRVLPQWSLGSTVVGDSPRIVVTDQVSRDPDRCRILGLAADSGDVAWSRPSGDLELIPRIAVGARFLAIRDRRQVIELDARTGAEIRVVYDLGRPKAAAR